MKNYLLGFLGVMAIGLTFALLGVGGASNMFAAMLVINDLPASTTTAPVLVDVPASSTPNIDPVEPAPVQADPDPVVVRVAVLNNLVANQQLTGMHMLGVSVNDNPESVTFSIRNIGTTIERRVLAECASTQEIKRECKKEIDTQKEENGKYSIVAQAIYTDGAIIRSNEIFVYINNTKPLFIFSSLASPVAGEVTIGGSISEATAVEFMYIPTGGVQPVRIGNAVSIRTGTESIWAYRWDTRQVADGAYAIFAKVTSVNNKEPYKAGETTIKIVNTVEQPVVPVDPTASSSEDTLEEVLLEMTAPQEEPPKSASTTTVAGRFETQIELLKKKQEEEKKREEIKQEEKRREEKREEKREEVPLLQTITPPIVQRIQSISTGLQGGGSVTTTREIEVLKKELWGDVNPTSPEVRAKTQYQSAKTFGTTVNASVLQVENIALSTTTAEVVVPIATTTAEGKAVTVNEKRTVVKEKLRLAGKALPDIYVTIYVYSEVPTIAVVKTDRNGNWVYELDNKLADGDHEAYVTINDKTGKVVAKSARFGFVKTAEAVTVEDFGALGRAEASTEDPVQAAKRQYSLIAFLLIGAGLLAGVFLMLRAPKGQKQDFI
ncbi:MAG: hypothetical protein UT41_C0001G0527 [Candidatus Wolfebacteria bacterium GW2011_GWC2_39_22]|uniref:Bacterial Ig-like domain-containing protein n=1 Tax=Candidatus Wolfebacteria bacterium GW2011_GWC2_39_22 TaxID=1619013 RepID=A0A0G0NBV0_9BACT|nr:MAG: hypothetical protein UT41_C0001G0527 [Candidatus Wolfebacteria bacterium GW2011_GWC2_39_22]HBI25364.1 hypothetical protein [Candidatus Wolfebacteria bacterium]